MTDIRPASPLADTIDRDDDTAPVGPGREEDALPPADATRPHVRPLRRAVREDAAGARAWGRDRAARLRGAVRADPVRATLYALGLGVVIGLLITRESTIV